MSNSVQPAPLSRPPRVTLNGAARVFTNETVVEPKELRSIVFDEGGHLDLLCNSRVSN